MTLFSLLHYFHKTSCLLFTAFPHRKQDKLFQHLLTECTLLICLLCIFPANFLSPLAEILGESKQVMEVGLEHNRRNAQTCLSKKTWHLQSLLFPASHRTAVTWQEQKRQMSVSSGYLGSSGLFKMNSKAKQALGVTVHREQENEQSPFGQCLCLLKLMVTCLAAMNVMRLMSM